MSNRCTHGRNGRYCRVCFLEKENKRLSEMLVKLKHLCDVTVDFDNMVYQCTYCSSCVDMACFDEDQKEIKHKDDCLWCEVDDV